MWTTDVWIGIGTRLKEIGGGGVDYRCVDWVDWKRLDMNRPRLFDCYYVNLNEIEGNRLGDVDYRCVNWKRLDMNRPRLFDCWNEKIVVD